MSWMNRDEIEEAAARWFDPETQPNLHSGAQSLLKLMEWTDGCSDGWPYWQKPSRAADKLMGKLTEKRMAQYRSGDDADITDAELRKLLAPIKSFLTRNGTDHADVLSPKVEAPAPVPSPLLLTPEERQLLSEAVNTAWESQLDTLNYAMNHAEDYDPGDVDTMKARMGALRLLEKRI